ncbi:MAG: ethanolamine ammonia-lyase reactivating factor EutA [Clostridia bacterium]|nr:ethanolamine ammonia-lyase reactivating factor EutA [Clostridia bacterium]
MKKDILSVGIDIGTTTTSMIVSRLGISNTAASYRVPEVSITTKDIIYRSPLYLTPQKDRDLLDGEAIRQIVEKEYRAAGIRPEDVDTGAVIITGESSLKENPRSSSTS